MRLQRIRDGTLGRPPGAPPPPPQLDDNEREITPPVSDIITNSNIGINKKRKASDGDDSTRKRSRGGNALPEGFFNSAGHDESEMPAVPLVPAAQDIQLPSRPATPLKLVEENPPKAPAVDEDEWAAFEADIAAAEAPTASNAIISAPALSAAELAAQSVEESNGQRKERQEAELEGDKEDAARKLEDEFEEMESLEERVRRMREKREALRLKHIDQSIAGLSTAQPVTTMGGDTTEEDDEEEDDDWDGFRLKG
jgi:hypothetical protein